MPLPLYSSPMHFWVLMSHFCYSTSTPIFCPRGTVAHVDPDPLHAAWGAASQGSHQLTVSGFTVLLFSQVSVKMIEIVIIFDLLLLGKTASSSANTRTTAFLNQKGNTHICLSLLSHSGTDTLSQENLRSEKKIKIFLSTTLFTSPEIFCCLKLPGKLSCHQLQLSIVPLKFIPECYIYSQNAIISVVSLAFGFYLLVGIWQLRLRTRRKPENYVIEQSSFKYREEEWRIFVLRRRKRRERVEKWRKGIVEPELSFFYFFLKYETLAFLTISRWTFVLV